MTEASHPDLRLEELLAEQTDRPLTYDESAELQRLLRANPSWSEEDFELAAAASMLAIEAAKDGSLPALPAGLKARITASAMAFADDEMTSPVRVPSPRGDTVRTPSGAPKLRDPADEGGLEAATALELDVKRVLDVADLELPGLDPGSTTAVDLQAAAATARREPEPREDTVRPEATTRAPNPFELESPNDTADWAPGSELADAVRAVSEEELEAGEETPAAGGPSWDALASMTPIPSAARREDPGILVPPDATVRAPSVSPRAPSPAAEAAPSPPAEVIPIRGGTGVPGTSASRYWPIIALAASIAALVLGYLLATAGVGDSVRGGGSLASQRTELLESAKDAVTITWSAASDPLGAPVAGDVVWSDSLQAGYMRFLGLAKNDITKLQYQLWIFDAERDERYPVDGGVFDVDAETGEVIVPIKAKIPVTKATLFAVTAERPGGVVVSTRERLVVVAKVL